MKLSFRNFVLILIVMLLTSISTVFIYSSIQEHYSLSENQNSITVDWKTLEFGKNLDMIDDVTLITKSVFGRSTEAGQIMAAYYKDRFQYISTRFFGETGQTQTEYFFYNDLIVIVRLNQHYPEPFAGEYVKIEKNTYFLTRNKLYKVNKLDNGLDLLSDEEKIKEAEWLEELLEMVKSEDEVLFH